MDLPPIMLSTPAEEMHIFSERELAALGLSGGLQATTAENEEQERLRPDTPLADA